MDPYLGTIPYNQGEQIKERVSERDGFDSEGRPTKRARADARTSPIATGATAPS